MRFRCTRFQSLRFHCSFSLIKSDISYNCDMQVFKFNGVKQTRRNSRKISSSDTYQNFICFSEPWDRVFFVCACVSVCMQVRVHVSRKSTALILYVHLAGFPNTGSSCTFAEGKLRWNFFSFLSFLSKLHSSTLQPVSFPAVHPHSSFPAVNTHGPPLRYQPILIYMTLLSSISSHSSLTHLILMCVCELCRGSTANQHPLQPCQQRMHTLAKLTKAIRQ